jgi:hypothetical protein
MLDVEGRESITNTKEEALKKLAERRSQLE